MLDYLLGASALVALAGVLTRNLTAGALLTSFVLSLTLCKIGVEFNAAVWMVIDTAVLMVVIRRGMPRVDWVIVALFPVAWVLYIAQPRLWAETVIVIVAAQLLLTFPAKRLGLPILKAWARFNRDYDPWRDGDLRAYA